jgi:hypothetical protein
MELRRATTSRESEAITVGRPDAPLREFRFDLADSLTSHVSANTELIERRGSRQRQRPPVEEFTIFVAEPLQKLPQSTSPRMSE